MAFESPGMPTPKKIKTKKKASVPAGTGSLDFQFANDLSLGKSQIPEVAGMWALRTDDPETIGNVFRWNSEYWEYVSPVQGQNAAALWLIKNDVDNATRKKAVELWGFGQMLLKNTNPMPLVNESDFLIPTRSGYLRVEPNGAIRLLKPDQSHGIDFQIKATLLTPPKFGEYYTPAPVPRNSKFGKYLETSLSNLDVRGEVQEVCAQTLIRKNFEMCGFFTGSGKNGKSIMLGIMGALHRKVCSLDLRKLGERFALAPLVDASIVIIDEVKNAPFEEEIFKSLISQSVQGVEKKYKDGTNFTPKAKFLCSANNPPPIQDKSGAVQRRILFIPFEIKVETVDRDLLKDIIACELQIVLDWLLEGLIRLLRRGDFKPMDEMPQIIQDENNAIREDADSSLSWIQSEGVRSGSLLIQNEDIYAAYVAWAEESHIDHPLGYRSFFIALKHHIKGIKTEQRTIIRKDGTKAKKRFSSISIGFIEEKTPAEHLDEELNNTPYAPTSAKKLPTAALH